jgi:hypothetical protein
MTGKVTVFWEYDAVCLIDRHQRFGETCCLHLESITLLFYPEEGGSMFVTMYQTVLRHVLSKL